MIFKILKMALTVFLVVFVVAMLYSYNDSGQIRPKMNPPIFDSTFATVPPSILQSVLIDSITNQEKIKKELVSLKDSMTVQITKNRKLVISGINEIVRKRPDTVYIPYPLVIDSAFNHDYNYLIHNLK